MAVVAGMVAAALLASPASACSCAGIENPRAALASADGAFVGVIERVDDGVFHYRVEHAVKGVGGETVAVRSSTQGCGLEGKPGSRDALFLDRSPSGEWSSHLCMGIHPDRLLEAARPLPAPNGNGPPAFVVGNSVGDHRSMLLDARGRTLAYGDGPQGAGDVIDIDVCPGGRRAVEGLTSGGEGDHRPILVVRSIQPFRIERTAPVSEVVDQSARSWRVLAVQCRGPSAETIDVVVAQDGDSGTRTFLFRWADRRWRRVTQTGEDRLLLSDDPTTAIVRNGERVERVDIDTGVSTPFFHVSTTQGSALSPDGRLLAIVTMNPERYRPEKLVVVGTGDGAVQGTYAFSPDTDMVDLVWADDGTLAVSGSYRHATLTFFDAALRVVGSVGGWQPHGLVATDGRVFGVPYGSGALVEARREWNVARPFVRLPDGATYALAAVPPATRPVTTTTTTTTTAAVRADAPVEPAPPASALPEIPRPMAAPPPVAPASSTRPWAPAGAATVLLGAAVAAIALRHKSLMTQ